MNKPQSDLFSSLFMKHVGGVIGSWQQGAIAEELGWTPQSSPGVAQLHAKHTNTCSLPPPLDTKVPYGAAVYYEKYVCASEENGLTCWNTETGHGAFMNRDGVTTF